MSATSSFDAIFDAVLAFVNADTWRESKDIVVQQRYVLLTDVADEVFADLLADYEEDADVTHLLQTCHELLTRCRVEGIDVAFADHIRPLTNNLDTLLDEIFSLTGRQEMSRRVELCQDALKLVTKEQEPQRWAMLNGVLGSSLLHNPLGPRAENIELAISHHEHALLVYTRQAFPKEWAMIQNDLATAYLCRIKADRAENLELAIKHFKDALTIRTYKAAPNDWAMTQLNLGSAYRNRKRGVQAENFELAIEHYKNALVVYTRQAFPSEWAMTQNNLANAYRERIKGARADNIERAITHGQSALIVSTYETNPFDWARIQNNLAIAYNERIRGVRKENIELAITHYQNALVVYTRQAFPEQWAMTQNNLALAYSSRIRGTRADNIELAIEHYQNVLTVRTHEAFSEKWAMAQNNLASAYSSRIKGLRAENIELAIQHYQNALTVRTYQTFPSDWAMTQNNLANAYTNRIQGSQAENIELAIQHYQNALEVYTREGYPYDWAMTQNGLAIAYNNRIREARAENIELAIFHYQQALIVYTHQALPDDWAMTQHNIAVAYSDRIRGSRVENIELAIYHNQQALIVYTRQAFPLDWAMTQNSLANSYRERIRGSRVKNIELALSHYQHALVVYTRQALPEKWAMMQNNLAIAYRDRIRGSRADNIELALSHYQHALVVYTLQAFPLDWAMIHHNLAATYPERIIGSPTENIELAIYHNQHALTVRTRQALPEKWAMTQNNLALAYSDRIRGSRADNIERAIEHYQHALTVYTRQTFPEKWAMTQNNLAISYRNRIRGSRADNIERAIEHYQHALTVRTPETLPRDCRQSAYWLGHLLYEEKCFAEARQALVTAHQAVEALRGEETQEQELRKIVDDNADLYAKLVFCCLSKGDSNAAFEYAAAGKGRAFVDLLSSTRFDLSAVGLDNDQFQADWQAYQSIREEIDELLLFLAAGDRKKEAKQGKLTLDGLSGEQVAKQWRKKQDAAAKQWQKMTYDYPALTACERAPSLSVEEACRLASKLNATLVEYYQHAEGWCAFVVQESPPEPVEGPVVRYVSLPLLNKEFLEEMSEWVEEIGFKAGRSMWTLQLLDKWHEAVIAPLGLEAKESEHVVLAPFGELRYLPLFAARDPKTGQYVAQMQQLAFIPSLGALRVAYLSQKDKNNKQQSLNNLLSVAYSGEPPLPNVIPEANAVANYATQATLLQEENATPQRVIERARDKQALHLGCHGIFDREQPQESGLMLASGWLTVQRIIAELRLNACKLVTLGACQSWVLTQAIMTAGAPSVVSSLWSVDDSATRALFEAFYAHIANGHPPANALRQATALIRQQAAWQHPFYWAAFTVNGLAHGPLPSQNDPVPFPIEHVTQQIRTLYRSTTRGNPTMNSKRIKIEARTYLKGIAHHQSQLAKALSAAELTALLNQLSTHQQQLAAAQSESQLLTACDAIHQLVENTPILRKFLVSPETNVAQTKQERAVKLKHWQNTAQTKQADPKMKANLDNQMKKVMGKMDEALKGMSVERN